MIERFAEEFETLTFTNPADGVLQITMEGPGLNSVDPRKHRQLADVWLAVDRDPDVRVALLAGAGKAFSAGGSFELLDAMTEDYGTALEVLGEARALVLNVINCSKPIVSAMWGPAVGAGLVAGLLADVSVVGKRARISTPDLASPPACAAICWPMLCMAGKYYLLTCRDLSGEEAERTASCRCALMMPMDRPILAEALNVATELADGAQQAIRWTKHARFAYRRWLPPRASLAYEFLVQGPMRSRALLRFGRSGRPTAAGHSE